MRLKIPLFAPPTSLLCSPPNLEPAPMRALNGGSSAPDEVSAECAFHGGGSAWNIINVASLQQSAALE